jgi:predicted RNA-binding protein YlxR (DUF448 family)
MLVRIVVVEEPSGARLVPDLRHRLPGRGAWLHPDQQCLDLARRRRAFPRALRHPGPLADDEIAEHLRRHPTDEARLDPVRSQND